MKRIFVNATLALSLLTSTCAVTNAQRQGRQEMQVKVDAEDNQRALQGMADSLLPRLDNMPHIRVLIGRMSEFPSRAISGQSALAFFNSNYDGKQAIVVNPKYVVEATFIDMVDSVKHELIHAWVHWRGIGDDVAAGHGEPFIRKALELKLNLDAVLTLYPETKSIYGRLKAERGERGQDGIGAGQSSSGIPSGARPIEMSGQYLFTFIETGEDSGETFLVSQKEEVKVGERFRWRDRSWRVTHIVGKDVILNPVTPDTAPILGNLPAPKQISPANGSVFSLYPRVTELHWSSVTGAAQYVVEVDVCQPAKSRREPCPSPSSLFQRTFPSTKTESSIAYRFDFTGAQPGRWRVWAVDKNGNEGARSEWWVFSYTQ
jgi:hypothetical protein